MSSKSLNQLMEESICAFAKAKDDLAIARRRVADERARETYCLNLVNDAQKKLDELITSLKKEAPHDSDWHQAQLKGVPE